MVGLDNAGKTTILYQFLMNEVVQTSPTIGSNVEEVVFRNIHFLVWDLGGQQSLRSAWSTYYTNTEVGLIAFIHVLLAYAFHFISLLSFLSSLLLWSSIPRTASDWCLLGKSFTRCCNTKTYPRLACEYTFWAVVCCDDKRTMI